MSAGPHHGVAWSALWRSGRLFTFCIISLGIFLHAGVETMISTIMAAMVNDIGGIQLIGWSFAIYEVGAIVAGTAMGRLTLNYSVAGAMAGAAAIYCLGCIIAALAPAMPVLLLGRLIEGLGGGGLVAMAFVATERLFPRAIWPQLFSILSAVWGVAAFSGPLIGALWVEHASWRWAFGAFAVAGGILTPVFAIVLRASEARASRAAAPGFPAAALACLAAGIMLVAAAGLDFPVPLSLALLAGGLAGVAGFFRLDARNPATRMFPSRPFRLTRTLGSGMVMVAALAMATVSFTVYGPLLLASLHGFSPLLTGYIIASESLSWSILSILVAGARPRHEPAIIRTGAAMIALGVAGLGLAVPLGSIPAILACALLQGGGFGIAWPFAIRKIVEAAPADERTIAASAAPALQRMGYAVGAALAGIIANMAGFSGGFTRAAAASAAPILFFAFVPLALFGCVSAWRLSVGRLPG
jgi:MFS family permease